MFVPVLISKPSNLPVTLAEAKAHVRVEHSEDDSLIAGLIESATSYLDGYTGILGRALIMQTWRQDFAGFCEKMRLSLYPAQSVSSVTYVDSAGVSQTLSAGAYMLRTDELGAYVSPTPSVAWPVGLEANSIVSVTYVAGEAQAPAAIKQAVLLMIGDWYRSRETFAIGVTTERVALSATVNALIAPFRRAQI
jgi:uncharacterized phiE125 gp8 family phage protein